MKNEILDLLKKQYPGFVSGEEISAGLSVSRTAIWKHIQSLKEEGYVIESQPRNGYRLVKVPDRLYPQEIMAGLQTAYVGQSVVYFDTTTSTNEAARELAAQGFGDGSVVVAEKQQKGKGRMGRQWSSPHGKGLWFSLILRPRISPTEAHKYTLLTGVAVTRAVIKVTGAAAGIKWPNDILIKGKKVCGILTEMNAEMETVNYIVTGIGVNVNLAAKDFPAEIKETATSLYIETGQKVDRVRLLQHVLQEMEHLHEEFKSGHFPEILAEWKKLSVTLKEQVTVSTLKESFTGIAVDIDDEGTLIVEKGDGQKVKVIAGDVTLSKK